MILCYEHVGEKTKKPHVHLLLLRVSCTTARLKQLAAPWVPFGMSGNDFWSFKTKSKVLGPVNADSSRKYVIYMTKGEFRPSYNKGVFRRVFRGLQRLLDGKGRRRE